MVSDSRNTRTPSLLLSLDRGRTYTIVNNKHWIGDSDDAAAWVTAVSGKSRSAVARSRLVGGHVEFVAKRRNLHFEEVHVDFRFYPAPKHVDDFWLQALGH